MAVNSGCTNLLVVMLVAAQMSVMVVSGQVSPGVMSTWAGNQAENNDQNHCRYNVFEILHFDVFII